MWSELEYTTSEAEMAVEVCVETVGPLNTDVAVHLSSIDHTAVGRKAHYC